MKINVPDFIHVFKIDERRRFTARYKVCHRESSVNTHSPSRIYVGVTGYAFEHFFLFHVMSLSPKSLERLFQSNIPMSPSRSRKPIPYLRSRHVALNRAAHTLAEIKEIRKKRDELTVILRKLEREYYKLARRAAMIPNANLKSGPLIPSELNRLRISARMVKNMATANRTTKHWGLPLNIRNKIARLMPSVRGRI